ncbi:1,4-alpha-glucan branching protein GlgB [Enterococcus timonensis]|uniref:1,4-alpha-glucan branching protein GlgB n=1 Tax=Enterococcus timonensis TaxID=1852364 RepID=UPI0008DB1640|nr:1,4-alpha-glucan branching protein GlgB [Enterococcus timonensis]
MENYSMTDQKEAARTFLTGENFYAQQFLGCQKVTQDGKDAFQFNVWAPNALAVSLVSDFTDWTNGQVMEKNHDTGIWSCVNEQAQLNDFYKFKVKRATGETILKTDPFATVYELRPDDAACVYSIAPKKWKDGLWFGRKKRQNLFKRPLNIYEVHANSWQQHEDGSFYTWKELTKHLIPYVKDMGYTHLEFLPLTEYPLDASWGYQSFGYFALTSRFGTPEDFQDFVEACHLNNLGVFMDWVPGHFCPNDDMLAYFDGTAQFEYKDGERAKNVGWGALNFDLGKPQVQSFLISSILFWLDTYHLDGIRVDAVSNMLYRDFDQGPWSANVDGGNENYEGLHFLKKMNAVVHLKHPTALIAAEESSHQIKITGPLESGGLGFDYKWNMGWMNDILKFFEMDPIYRKQNFSLTTFSFMYTFNENYILPLSHDEGVHGKKSLMHKMWGDRYRQKAQLRNLYTYMTLHPGKKLNFMGNEWGQFLEWKFQEGLEWVDLEDELNQKMLHFTSLLNHLYKNEKALFELDHDPAGLEIIDADNIDQTVLSFIRKSSRKNDFVIGIFNFTPVERQHFKVGVPYSGTYEEILNSEMTEFGGTFTQGNPEMKTMDLSFKQFSQQIDVLVPAFGAVLIKPKKIITRSFTGSKKENQKGSSKENPK